MAILFGVFGDISKEISKKIDTTLNVFFQNKHTIRIREENFFCIGGLDKKNDTVLVLPNKGGMVYGRIFNKSDYKAVKSLDHEQEIITPEDFFAHYWGRFGGAFWDTNQRKLSLVRDPLGLSTIFYYTSANGIIFSSDLALLYDVLDEKPAINWNHFAEFLCDINHALPSTPFKDIKELLPGTKHSFSQNEDLSELMWIPTSQDKQFIHETDEIIEEGLFHELLACSHAWLSDVKGVTLELSGGLDSSGLFVLYNHLTNGEIPLIAVHHTDTGCINSQEIKYASQLTSEYNIDLKILIIMHCI